MKIFAPIQVGYINTKGNLISKQRAIQIASFWHSGQWSGLYSFLSSGSLQLPILERCLTELIKCYECEAYNAKSVYLTTTEKKEVYSLIRWISYKVKELYKKHVQVVKNSHYKTLQLFVVNA